MIDASDIWWPMLILQLVLTFARTRPPLDIDTVELSPSSKLTFHLINRLGHLGGLLGDCDVTDAERLPLHVGHIIHKVFAEASDASEVHHTTFAAVAETNLT